MPTFDLQWTSGVIVEPFDDPDKADGSQPGRLNPRQSVDPLHVVTTPGTLVEISAVVDGVVAPTDAAISGSFMVRIIEWPGSPGGCRPELISPVGQSSRQRFRASAQGHYAICFLRDGGPKGRVIAHLSCQP